VTETQVVRVKRVMPAQPGVVFDEWLDTESLADWMCPRPDHCLAIVVEPRVGGRLRFDVDHAGTSVLIAGQFLAIERPHLLRFTWSNSSWADPTAASIVTVTFEPCGADETLMSIEHALVPADDFENFHTGWTLVCEQLAAVLPR
jgi:uncharacterized protein YndB with AHSA1/START domain